MIGQPPDLKPDLTYAPVASGSVSAVAHDAAARVLGVVFRGGAEYRYSGVPAEVHAALVSESDRRARGVPGASVGALLARAVKGKYPYERVDRPAAPAPPESDHHDDFYDVAADLLRREERRRER